MTTPPPTLKTARDETIDALCRHFADDAISMAELDRRLDRARGARTRAELDALLRDLPGHAVAHRVAAKPEVRAPTGRPVPDAARSERTTVEARGSSHLAFAIMGGTRRAGRWKPPSEMVAVAIMGGVELDFRDAVLEPGVTEINCFTFWGGVEITVPPDVHVESRGFALMGGFDQTSDLEVRPDPDAPVIRVNGFALMGGVDIKVRARGEGRSDAQSLRGRRRRELPRRG